MSNSYVNDFSTSTQLYYQDLKKHKPISREEEIELVRLAKDGDIEARNKLLTANLRFVFDIAKRYKGKGASIDDLISEGNLGLIRAINKYDETKGIKFISYAVWWIRQAILEFIQKSQLKSSVEIIHVQVHENEYHELENQESINNEDGKYDMFIAESDDIEIKESNENNKAILEHLLSKVDSRSREILELYYGLNDIEPLSLDEIGVKFNLSKERVRQICKRNFLLFRSEILQNNFELSIYH